MNQTPTKLDSSVKKIVAAALNQPSKQFGELVLEINHKHVGQNARVLREKYGIQAQEVAKVLKVSKVVVHFMETGRKQWDRLLLERYIKAVYLLRKKKKQQNEATS